MLLLAVVAVGGIWPVALEPWSLIPILLGALVLALAHGGVDWSILRRGARNSGPGSLLPILATYIALAGLSAAVVLSVPFVGLWFFLAIAAWHFGRSDARDFASGSSLPPQDVRREVVALSRGLLLMMAPFAFQPTAMHAVCTTWCEMLGGPWLAETAVSVWNEGATLLFRAALVLSLIAAISIARHSIGSSAVFLVETAALIAGFAILPPLLAFGLYVIGWHGLRRLLQQRASRRRPGHRTSIPFLIAALAVVAGIGLAIDAFDSLERFAILLLLPFAVVTPAHDWLVHRRPATA